MSVHPEAMGNIRKSYHLKHLHNLMLEWDPDKGPVINFMKYKKLSALSIHESSLKSTQNIKLPNNIRSLFFVSCDSLQDISNLSSYTELRTLGFSGCKKLRDIRSVKGMKNLSWLSCPPFVDQAQFDSLIPSLPSLQVLELIDCDSLRNLEVLKKANRLKSLTLADKNINPLLLFEMKNLELLVIKPDTGKTGENQIQELKIQLPNTLVVPGKGLCLGSGWILLIIPMVVIGVIFLRRMRV